MSPDTTRRLNLDSIIRQGLLTGRGRGDSIGKVWFHTEDRNTWAETHVRERHEWYNDSLVHLTCHVPMPLLKKHSNGLYYITTDLMPGLIVSATKVSRHVEIINIL